MIRMTVEITQRGIALLVLISMYYFWMYLVITKLNEGLQLLKKILVRLDNEKL
jgi:hypothetical protein